jgi:DNA-binding NarL/FixJ family response regulator
MAIKVLHIEDDMHIVDLVKTMLNEHDKYITEAVNNKNDAILSIKKNKFDYILVDLNLNGKEWEGIEIIKSIVNETEAVIIVLSANYLNGKQIYECLKNGASAYIFKLNINDLSNTITQLKNGTYVTSHLMLSILENQLTMRDKQLIEDFREGKNISDIAKKENLSYSSIISAKKRLQRKIGSLKRFIKLVNISRSKK